MALVLAMTYGDEIGHTTALDRVAYYGGPKDGEEVATVTPQPRTAYEVFMMGDDTPYHVYSFAERRCDPATPAGVWVYRYVVEDDD